ncbi:MAG: transporter [Muribaculaceae bacterium]|nr:transporter [Muribaculaceae bacterium]
MNAREFQRRAKPWVLPLAMLCGLLFHPWLEAVAWVVPYLIFTMLTITFCRVRPRQFELSPMLWIMLAIQLAGSAVVFLVLRPFSLDVAQAVFICVLCPTATAAPVVTGMLGGSVPRVAAYSVLCNLAVALLAPLLFVWVGEGAAAMSFADEFKSVALQVAPLIVLPLALAFGLYFFAPKVHSAIGSVQGVSFYLWAVSLVVVVGRAVAFILAEPAAAIPEMIVIALGAGIVCVLQFAAGRRIGRRYGDAVSGAQGLGQKNTVLAIWMALTYLNPIASIGPAAYIVWQNSINSAQLYFKMKHTRAD